MLVKFYVKLLSLCFFCAACWGQSAQPGGDPVGQELFAPELVMQYHQEINLNDTQSKAIKDEIQKAQAKFLDMQWDAKAETEKLVQLLRARPVDESAVLAQVDKVLDRERAIKKTQLSLLVRIKNVLTEEQQKKLMELRGKSS